MKPVLKSFILWYIRIAANLQLWKTKPTIIGVAGSSGKTSLVKLIHEVLADKYTVRQTGGKNSEIGLPLNILRISIQDNSLADWVRILFLIIWRLLTDWGKCDYYLAEMGIDGPQEPYNMGYLLKIVKPTIGVVTNVSLEHSVYFDPLVTEVDEAKRREKLLELIAYEEVGLLRSLPKTGVAVVNRDDASLVKEKDIKAKQITVSLHNTKADLYVKNISTSLEKFVIDFVWREKVYTLTIAQALPEFYAYEFLFALAVAMSVDIGPQEAIESLQKHFSLPPGRFSVFAGIKQTTLIDSSYNNATLEPIMGILDMLKKIASTRRKVVIVGDMREQGSMSRKNHELLAEKLAHSVQEIILIGPLLANYAAPILKRKKTKFTSFQTFSQAKETILKTIKPKDIILVKGSQNTLFLERVVEMLLENKEEAIKLCRRGVFWDKIRVNTA